MLQYLEAQEICGEKTFVKKKKKTDRSEKIIKISHFAIVFKHNFGYAIFMSLNEASSMLFTSKLVRSAGFKVLPTWISVISKLFVFNLKNSELLYLSWNRIFFCLIRFFSAIILYIRNIFAMIRLPSFSTNINGNEVCTKKINQILKKN